MQGTYQAGAQRGVRGGQATSYPWAQVSEPGQQAPADAFNSWLLREYAFLGTLP